MSPRREHGFLERNGLSLVLAAVFLSVIVGQVLTGHHVWNEQRIEQQAEPVSLLQYLRSGHLASATFENWESEFLQMGMYVLLTVWLRQRGSAESRPLNGDEKAPEAEGGPPPWPVRRGGFWRWLYANSLSIALLLLFLLSFVLHAVGSWRRDVAERAVQGQPPQDMFAYLGGAPSSGSNRCRTGRASSSRYWSWWCCRSSCARRDRRNPNRWRRRTRRPAPERCRRRRRSERRGSSACGPQRRWPSGDTSSRTGPPSGPISRHWPHLSLTSCPEVRPLPRSPA